MPMDKLSTIFPIQSPDEGQMMEEDDSIPYSLTYCPLHALEGRECRPPFSQPGKSPEPEQTSHKESYYNSEFSSEEEEDWDGNKTKPGIPK